MVTQAQNKKIDIVRKKPTAKLNMCFKILRRLEPLCNLFYNDFYIYNLLLSSHTFNSTSCVRKSNRSCSKISTLSCRCLMIERADGCFIFKGHDAVLEEKIASLKDFRFAFFLVIFWRVKRKYAVFLFGTNSLQSSPLEVCFDEIFLLHRSCNE